MKREIVECRRSRVVVEDMKFVRADEWVEVRVMCRAEGWAMVQVGRWKPFVVQESDLRATNEKGAARGNSGDPQHQGDQT